MKKFFALVLIAILALTATAFAETYRYEDDITFNYDEKLFDVIRTYRQGNRLELTLQARIGRRES